MVTKKETKKPSKEEELQQRIEELTNTLKRNQAEFDNYRKRVEREKQEFVKFSAEGIIKKFLPILDNLELALKHCTKKDDFYQGIEMIYANIRDMLRNENVNAITAIGLPFDPFRHEALLTKESDKPANTVIEEMQKGYTLHDKVIRPAKVTISKGKAQGGKKNE